jgi:hypothetical protein
VTEHNDSGGVVVLSVFDALVSDGAAVLLCAVGT